MPGYETFVDDAVDGVLTTVARRLTGNFHQVAIEAGWPEDTARSLSLKPQDGHLVVRPTVESGLKEAEDQEFGTVGSPPKAAVSAFMWSHDTNKKIEEESLSAMDDFVVEIDKMFA
jgi:hypothetical protein